MEKRKKSVGILILAKKTNRFLLLHRVNKPVAWSTLAGKMEEGETPKETIKREILEEIGINSNILNGIEEVGMVGSHHVMVGITDKEFEIPNLKLDENDDYGWFTEKTLPSPMHPKWEDSFNLIKPLINLREVFVKNFKHLIK